MSLKPGIYHHYKSKEKLFGLIIHRIVLANDKSRGAWKTLLASGFGGWNALVSRLRRKVWLLIYFEAMFICCK